MVIPVYSCSVVYLGSVSVHIVPHSTGYTVRTLLYIYMAAEVRGSNHSFSIPSPMPRHEVFVFTIASSLLLRKEN
jgi:hypothetical protein